MPSRSADRCCGFQSHAGSIEALIELAQRLLAMRLFQSHAGSIEAATCALMSARGLPFQSHAGSIEACVFTELIANELLGFNPTLVRLRHIWPRWTGPHPAWFQSHAGSIEALLALHSAPPNTIVSIPRWFD